MTLILFVFLIFVNNLTPLRTPMFNYFSLEKANGYFKNNSYLSLSDIKTLNFFGKKSFVVPIEEFADFSDQGYYVKYDKMGMKISLFYQETLLQEWVKKYNYPRLVYPYLFLFSSDMSKAEVFRVDAKDFKKTVQTLYSKDMFTSWAVSEKGNLFILGDLSGTYFIYDFKNTKLYQKSMEKSRINYIKGVSINEAGGYLVEGSLYPEMLVVGNIHEEKKDFYQFPPTGRSKRLILDFSRFAVIEKESGFFIFDKKRKKISEFRNGGQLYGGKEFFYQNKNYLLLMSFKKSRISADLFIENRFLYSITLEKIGVPVIYSEGSKMFIFWDKGVIRL